MDKFTEQYRKQFYQEATEIIEKLNDEILRTEADPDNQDLLNSVFRGIHTIKGSAGSFELEDISEFAHHLEWILTALRDGRISLTPELVDVILAGTDHIGKMIQDHAANRTANIDQNLIERFKSFSETAPGSKPESEKAEEISEDHIILHSEPDSAKIPLEVQKIFQEAAALGLYIFRIQVKYTSELLENGYDPLVFLKNLRQSCTSYHVAETGTLPGTDEFDPMRLYLYPTIYAATALSAEEICDLTFDPSLISVEPVSIKLDEIYSEPLHEFVDSAVEMLESMEKAVIDYETSGSQDALNEIFRAVHSFKGDADMVGLQEITLFAHALETLLERLRSGAIQRTFALVDAILQSVDFLRQSVLKLGQGIKIPEFPPVFETLKHYADVKEDLDRKQDILKDITPELRQVFTEQTMQYKEILLIHASSLPLDQENRKVVERALKGIAKASEFVRLKTLRIQAGKAIAASELQDWQTFSELMERISAFISSLEEDQKPEPVRRISPEHVRPAKKDTEPEIRAMRVDERKVDNFTNLVGELLIARNTYEHLMNQLTGIEGSARQTVKALKDNLHLFSSLTNDIHHGVMSLRMIPVRRIFQRFNRIVRDISRKQKKSIQLLTDGEDIEIDKKVADMLSDPLVHLVRNACDHGIELPEARKAADKPEKGTVIIRASQEGTNLCISVIDDGRGIDRQALYEKAQKAGIKTGSPDDPSFQDIVFTPGLSTTTEVSDISGRGVGLDVVRTTVRSLSGSVRLVSNEGKGMEAALSIPITLGIDVVLFVEAGGISYAVPLENIAETLKIPVKKLKRAGKQMLFHHRGQVLPAARLETLLAGHSAQLKNFRAQDKKEASIVIVRTAQGKYGLIVDRLNKNTEVAIKPPPSILADIDIISGVTIMGDGKVFLVLNPEKLLGIQELKLRN